MNDQNSLPKVESQNIKRGEELSSDIKFKKLQWWKISSKQENRLLRFISLGLMICLMVLIGGYYLNILKKRHSSSPPRTAVNLDNEYCLTKGCVLSAANVIDRLDHSVDPCEDFYDFACGNFVKRVVLPDDKSFITSISTTNDILLYKLRTLIESPINETVDTWSTKLVKSFFTSCMNLELIEKKGLTPLEDVLTHLGGWPVIEKDKWESQNFSLTDTLYKIRKLGFSAANLFTFRVSTDMRNTTRRIIEFEQAKLGMPSREYFMKGLESPDVQAYLDYQVSMAILLGASPITVRKELEENVKFEIQIANMSLPEEERRNLPKLYNKMTLKDLSELVPDIPWLELTNEYLPDTVQVEEDEEIIVTVPDFMIGAFELVRQSSNRTIANYLIWHVVTTSASFLTAEARKIELEYSKKLFGIGKEAPRWKDCMDLTTSEMPFGVAALYVRHFFDEDSKAIAEDMVGYIRKTFNDNLRTLDWMDEATKKQAIKKAEAIRSFIGYPKELLDEEVLKEHYRGLIIKEDNDLLSNMANLAVDAQNKISGELRKKVDKDDWRIYGAAAVVNAFYSSVDNAILFPAGILQGVFFDAERPGYMNYGGIGLVIGHEITHGFDDEGSQFNENGDLHDWWDFDTRNKFLNKSACIVNQYSSYYVPEVDLYLNGIITQGENIADNGGIKEAYNAYASWVQKNGPEKKLPGLNYSPEQMFWISSAHLWCSVQRKEYLKMSVLSKFHSPPRYRINGPMKNLKEFSKDWNCPIGSKMNPKNKCRVW